MSNIVKELGIPEFPHNMSAYLHLWRKGKDPQVMNESLKFLFGNMVGEVTPVFAKWGERIAQVYLMAACEGLPIRVFIKPSQFAGEESRFSIQFIPRSCPKDTSAWVAQFTFYETHMALCAHDSESVKHDTDWVSRSLSSKQFREWCTESILNMYQSCGKYIVV
ncbi:MAG: hypothetical protein HGA67_00110 [Candidatus Yonathbacteria bacterium]|nr:hypothetical protein [Candidatus Yonathbacteria bacterium]